MSLSLATPFQLQAGAQLVEFDSSTQGKSYRVELTDGRHFQVNEKLYHLLDALRVAMTLPALASAFAQRTGQTVAVEQLQQLGAQLVAQGVVTEAGKTPEKATATPASYLGLHYRWDLFSPATLAPIVRLLQICFQRGVAAILVGLIVGAHIWAYRNLGLTLDLQLENVSVPLLAGFFLISVIFHELGHLAACQRSQCPHGPLGFGLYFFMPVFYVDVTAAWRLNRYQRALVDAGGLYIQLLFVPLALWLFWATGDRTYLTAIALIDLVLISNLVPFMKLDGYWLLSDLTGVPNLHTRAGEAFLSLLSWLWHHLDRRHNARPATAFSKWNGLVRSAVWTYLALSMVFLPLELFMSGTMVVNAVWTYPTLWQTAVSTMLTASAQGDMATVLAQLSTLFFPTVMLLGALAMLKLTWEQQQAKRKAKVQQQAQLQPA